MLLFVGHGQTGGALIWSKPGPEPIQHPLGLPIHLGGVFYESETAQLGAKKYISAYREIRRNRQLLVNDPDSRQTRLVWSVKLGGVAIQENRTCVGPVGSRQNLHERALPGAIHADHHLGFAVPYWQIDVLYGSYV